MKPEVKKYLFDIVESISILELYLSDVNSYYDFSNDQKTLDAVERRLAIIGEALWQATKLDDSLKLTDMKKIIGLRHILVHDYDLIDTPILWTIVRDKIDTLKSEALTLLEE